MYVTDIHASPEEDNRRADYLAQLIIDKQPDIVVNGGDVGDFASLSSYDKGKRSAIGRSYAADLESHLQFQERMWDPVKARKKKMPYRVVLEGNHEHRIEKALDLSPEYAGTIGFGDLQLDEYYNEVVRYNGGTPGIIELEGILFAHYFITGVSGRSISGERAASALINKAGQSAVQGHVHTFDYVSKNTLQGNPRHGLIGGCYHSHVPGWAGNIGNLWKPGVAILNNVNKGDFDLEWISIDALSKEYGE